VEYSKKSAVLCLDEIKHASLYFDTVIPASYASYVGLLGQLCNERRNVSNSLIDTVFKDILGFSYNAYFDQFHEFNNSLWKFFEDYQSFMGSFEKNYNKYEYRKFLLDHFHCSVDDIINHLDSMHDFGEHYDRIRRSSKSGPDKFYDFISQAYIDNIELIHTERCRDIFKKFYTNIGLPRVSILLPASFSNYNKACDDDITITLSKLNLVDVRKADWQKILEFRRDSDARKKFRNFRLFMHKNYKDKSLSFIEDDISKRYEDYLNTCKDYNFETTTSSLSVALNSKSLQTTIITTACSVLFGDPLLILGTISTGLSVTLGNLVIGLAKNRHAFHKLKRDHDLAYIIEAKEILE